MSTAPVDLSTLPTNEVLGQLGEVLSMCLKSRGAAVFILREDGAVTVVDPRVLDLVPDDDMAFHLLGGEWSEAEIEQYLATRAQRTST